MFVSPDTLPEFAESFLTPRGWGVAQGDVFLRVDALVAVAMGAFFIWSTMSRKSANTVLGDA